MSGPWGDLVTSYRMRRRKQENFVVQMSLLMFEEPRGRPGQSNKDGGDKELRILTEASQRGTDKPCQHISYATVSRKLQS